MKLSHSRVDAFVKCPYKFKLRYIDELETLPSDDPQSPLILGHALHTGIEKDVQAATDEYYGSYPVINDRHVAEAIKLEYWIPKVKELLPAGEHEVLIEDDDFKGFIDLLVPIDVYGNPVDGDEYVSRSNEYDLYDFKYSNNVKNYMDSEQLHLYKYFFEKLNPGKKIRKLYFVFVPKSFLRIKYKNKTNPRDETIYEFRQRIIADLEKKEIQIIEINYDQSKVIDFLINGKHAIEAKEFNKNETRLCDWCEYQKYCMEGEDFDMLPKNERQEIGAINFMKGWIYGAPFSGKTTFLDSAPDPLNLNTDGNTKYVTMQRLYIRDEVTTTGRITNRKFAWEVLKEAIADLEKGSDFKTIIVDLVEDTREMCRLYMYDKLGITHESDDSFRAWDKVKTEYLSTMRRLLNLDYNVFLVSHEDISKDLTRRSGDKVTRISPNIQEALANKLAGMVDFVARVIVNDDDSRTLSFKANEVVFGGGRLKIHVNEIPLEWDALVKVYEEAIANSSKAAPKKKPSKQAQKIAEEAPFEITAEETQEILDKEEPIDVVEQEEDPAPKKRTRKARGDLETATKEPVNVETPEETVEEAPKRRRRRRKAE